VTAEEFVMGAMRLAVWAVLPAIACGDGLAPEVAADPPQQVVASAPSTALVFLRTADRFETPAIGYAGSQSLYVLAWREIAASPSADSVFRELAITATRAEGRLYGMVGLVMHDQTAFDHLAADLRWNGARIHTLFGCIATEMSADALLREVRAGEWSRAFQTNTFPNRPPDEEL
jgi:hypothetical protein